MLDIEAFKTEAEAYCERAGIKLSTLGAYAVGDKTVFSRLDRGGNVGVLTLKRILDYIAEKTNAETDGGAVVRPEAEEPEACLRAPATEQDAA